MTDWNCYFKSFFALLLLKNPKNQNFRKNEKISGDNIIFDMCTKNHNHIMYGSWYRVGQIEFFVILDHFLLLYPSNDPKTQNFYKIYKMPGDIILLHMCTINEDHMMYSSWDTECNRQYFLSFWTILLPT